MAGDESFDLAAAALRADDREMAVSLEVLVRRLIESLPAQTRVRRRGGLLRRDKRIESIEVRLGSAVYRLEPRRGALDCWRDREVGGISIKREQLDVASWLRALVADVDAAADVSARARSELQRLLG